MCLRARACARSLFQSHFIQHQIAAGEELGEEEGEVRGHQQTHSRHPCISPPVLPETPPLYLVNDRQNTLHVWKVGHPLPRLSLVPLHESLIPASPGSTLSAQFVGLMALGMVASPALNPFPVQAAVQANTLVTGVVSSATDTA